MFFEELFKDEDTRLKGLYSSADMRTMGIKYVDLLNSLVMSASDPKEMHAKLMELAPMHRNKGACSAYMEKMHKALVSVSIVL